MADDELSDDELAVLFEEAANAKRPEIPMDLTLRVLANAAAISAANTVPSLVNPVLKIGWFGKLFAPVGGMAGAFALGAFGGVGLVVGLADAETLYSLPVMGDILMTFSDGLGSISPLETLDYLMTEG